VLNANLHNTINSIFYLIGKREVPGGGYPTAEQWGARQLRLKGAQPRLSRAPRCIKQKYCPGRSGCGI